MTVGSKTTVTTINDHMTVTCSPGGHAFLQLLENVLVEVVDLRDVQEYPIDVSVWYYLQSTCIHVINSRVHVYVHPGVPYYYYACLSGLWLGGLSCLPFFCFLKASVLCTCTMHFHVYT